MNKIHLKRKLKIRNTFWKYCFMYINLPVLSWAAFRSFAQISRFQTAGFNPVANWELSAREVQRRREFAGDWDGCRLSLQP